MPLRDHFRPPLSTQRPWEGIHGAWAANIAGRLNQDLLPADYFAMPLVTVGGQVEVDVATFHEAAGPVRNGGIATEVYGPPQATHTAEIDFLALPTFEVQIHESLGGPQLRAAIEIVSPANKDRPRHRQAFAIKCAAYLQRGVSVAVIDVVSERSGNCMRICGSCCNWTSRSRGRHPRGCMPLRIGRDGCKMERRWRRGSSDLRLGVSCRRCRCGWRPICACRSFWKRPTRQRAARCGLSIENPS